MSDAKFTLYHFCCILLWFAQQQPWVWKDKSFKTMLCHMNKLILFLIEAPACLKASPPPKSFFSCYTFVGMCCLTVTHFSLSVSSPTCTAHWSYSGTHLKCHTRGSPLRKPYTSSLGQQTRTGRRDFCISVTKWFKKEDAGSLTPLWQCHTVVGKGRPERNTEILLCSAWSCQARLLA